MTQPCGRGAALGSSVDRKTFTCYQTCYTTLPPSSPALRPSFDTRTQFGYRTTPEIMAFLKKTLELRESLSAAAHLIHGSSEGRFTITYCPGGLTREEVEGGEAEGG